MPFFDGGRGGGWEVVTDSLRKSQYFFINTNLIPAFIPQNLFNISNSNLFKNIIFYKPFCRSLHKTNPITVSDRIPAVRIKVSGSPRSRSTYPDPRCPDKCVRFPAVRINVSRSPRSRSTYPDPRCPD